MSSDCWLYFVVSYNDGWNTVYDGHGCTCIFMCVRNETLKYWICESDVHEHVNVK